MREDDAAPSTSISVALVARCVVVASCHRPAKPKEDWVENPPARLPTTISVMALVMRSRRTRGRAYTESWSGSGGATAPVRARAGGQPASHTNEPRLAWTHF